MSAARNVIEAQAEALLRRLAREQESRSRRALDEAHENAAAIVSRAWQDARARIREAGTEERRAIERALSARRAELETSAMQTEQRSVRETLDRAWKELRQAMNQRWSHDVSRGQWCRAACRIAQDFVLNDSPRVIEYDPSCAGETELSAALAASGLSDAEMRPREGLGPGLRLRAGRVCIDATVDGLLASRERVEADLLDELDRQLDCRPESPA